MNRTAKGVSISVGVNDRDLTWAASSALHFHVGSMTECTTKRATVIPLNDQGVFGTVNVLTWAFQHSFERGPFIVAEHEDLVAFASASIEVFAHPERPARARARAESIAQKLCKAFPRIEAILGCGFPFYCDDAPSRVGTPDSIKAYIREQESYFRSKIVPRGADLDLVYERSKVRDLHLRLDRNDFDRYEFEKEGRLAPDMGPSRGSLRDFIAHNELDSAGSPWPCHLCTMLQDRGTYPVQSVTKDFERNCLDCRQTTLIPRNVSGLSNDIDLVLVADMPRDEIQVLAEDVASFIDASAELYRYDTDIPAMLSAEYGPVDVFICTRQDFDEACRSCASTDRWADVTLPAIALWLPITAHEMTFGLDFPLTLEPIRVRAGSDFAAGLEDSRHAYACRTTPEDVLETLRRASFYLDQLLSNKSIREHVTARLGRWQEIGMP